MTKPVITIAPYTPDLAPVWEDVISASANGTLMHSRRYMDYHAHRFSDASVLVYVNGSPVAVLPAHRVENEVFSHQGLTYGGLVIHQDLNTTTVIAVFREVLKYLYGLSVSKLYMKAVPSFYGTSSSEWLAYAMFLLEAKICRSDLSFVIPLPASYSDYTKGRKWALNKAIKGGLKLEEVNDLRPFWKQVLGPNLWARHGVKPVHSLEEIQWLAVNNKPFIRQFDVLEEGSIVAGMTVYETPTTAHAQYISASQRGKELSALDLLIDHLVQKVFSHKAFFDLGTVNEEQGRKINKGLMEWKESFGAKPYAHQVYKVETERFEVLGEILER